MVQAACGIVAQAENNMQKGGSVVNYQNASAADSTESATTAAFLGTRFRCISGVAF